MFAFRPALFTNAIIATMALGGCASTSQTGQFASLEPTCRVYAAQTSIQLLSGKASTGERKAGDARALGTLQRLRGYGGAGTTLIDELLRECG